MFKDVLKKARGFIKPAGQKRGEIEILPDDVFLVSYPKSGNTWMRFLIGNIFNSFEKTVDEVNFHTVHKVIPELSQGSHNGPQALPRVFKTHNPFNENFKKVVLILRDPMDVIFSYYHYLNGEVGVKISLSEVVYHSEYGINAIIEHTNSYIRHCEDLLLILYEGMRENPKGNVHKMCDFLELSVPDEVVQDAIEKSSFKSMRKIEIEKGRKYGNKNFVFTRSGKAGEGQRNMKAEDISFIMREIKKSPVLFLIYGRASADL